MTDDPYNLRRFVDAQAPLYERVRAELRNGQKETHWMWVIFPQISGLGSSPAAVKFAISSRGEAQAFLDHPLLGPRLRECTRLVTAVPDRSIGHSGLSRRCQISLVDDAVRQSRGGCQGFHRRA
jgi:uncharacterized protein (DUF1810 family)